MLNPRRTAFVSTVAMTLTLLMGCAPARAPEVNQSLDSARTAEQSTTRKVITIAIQQEPSNIGGIVEGTGSGSSGAKNADGIAHQTLAIEADIGTYEAQLAAEMISVERGTWQLNPDGTMETVWRLRPNVKWHDGTPFTSQDLLFSFTVFQDPDLPATGSQRRLMTSASAPDPTTFVVHWSSLYVDANRGQSGVVLPKHILEETYLNDKLGLPNHPYFTTSFVGLGPYRLARWELGSHMELTRFDDYFLGRPPLDRVVLRFVKDPNAMIASILAGEVDVVLPTGVDVETALEVRRRWEGTGHQVRADVSGALRQLELQHRPEYARPRNGITLLPVRQALIHAIDRRTLAEVSTQGLAPAADSWYAPGDWLRQEIEPSIPQFPYDPARAQTLLQQAGWIRGGDGVLTHQPTGERFEVEVWARGGGALDEKESAIVSDYWKAVGAQAIPSAVPSARNNDAEYLALRPGPMITQPGGDGFYRDRTRSSQIQTAANRWTGQNRAGYANQRVDDLLERIGRTIDRREQVPLHRDLVQEQMGDVALMPLYWEVLPILMVRGITGPKNVGKTATQNMFSWSRE